MKLDIMKKWTAALRSGEYKKTVGVLCKKDEKGMATGFCCLGVLTNLYLNEMGVTKGERETLLKGSHIPHKVQEWAGMRSTDGSFLIPKLSDGKPNLIALNDDDFGKRDFIQIAQAIEDCQPSL